ncbi:MAG: hypothetical protein ACPGQS_02515, partial [Bradymonadia bacterium]
FMCPEAMPNTGTVGAIDQTEPYNRVVSCAEVCSDLQNNINPVDGERVCGEVSNCDLTRCQIECERAPALFASNVDNRVIGRVGNGCPNNRILLPATDDSSAVYVKNLCVPCETICGRLRPSNPAGPSAWCGTRTDDCPALATNEICLAQCEARPHLFHVDTTRELCGNIGGPWAETRPGLCGLQCDSLNHEWGQDLDITAAGPRLRWENGSYDLREQTRICFRGSTDDDPDCDVVLRHENNKAQFSFDFTIMTNESTDAPARYALKLSARNDQVGNGTQRPVVFQLALHDSQAKSLLADTALTSYRSDPGVKGIEHTDNIMVSRRINIDGEQYTIEAFLEDVRIPSSILVEHIAFKIDAEQSLEGNDATCQNQCFEESGTSFCRSICNSDNGLMSMCGKSTNMPSAESVPFTSGGRNVACSSNSDDELPQFDASSCLRECERNRCDLQFQINAIWREPAAPTDRPTQWCKLLNFGGVDGWESDENTAGLEPTQLCCLCSEEYCDSLGSDVSHTCSDGLINTP